MRVAHLLLKGSRHQQFLLLNGADYRPIYTHTKSQVHESIAEMIYSYEAWCMGENRWKKLELSPSMGMGRRVEDMKRGFI